MPDRYSWQQFPISDYPLLSPLLAGLQALHGRQAASLLSGGLDGSISGFSFWTISSASPRRCWLFLTNPATLSTFESMNFATQPGFSRVCDTPTRFLPPQTPPSNTTPLSRSASRARWMILNCQSKVPRDCGRCSHLQSCLGGGQLLKMRPGATYPRL